ncbi:MAG: ATP-binding protein [Pseudomonadota bacterium]|nr:ATP-binding protein [Pseudomonadota bacterium]
MLACTHPRQEARLAALEQYHILDTPREAEFDDIVALVAEICEAPVAVVNFIDSDRQWFKAEVGLGVSSTPLDTSLCSHVILENDFVEIPDTHRDPRMSDNPLCVAEDGFRFYAGALLKTPEGLPLGTLCVLDRRPRSLTPLQRRTIALLADRVMSELNLRLALRRQSLLRREIDHRVKNSLASVGAIIGLQAARSASPETRLALDAVHARLTALEALHEELHQVGDGETVDFAGLIDRAVAKLRQIIPDRIAIDVDVAPHRLSSDRASAIALTVNEFVTNSAKHGFLSDSAGTIRVTGMAEDGGFRLVCEDDGAGDEAAIERIENSAGLGIRIIRTLAASLGTTTEWSAQEPGVRLEMIGPGPRPDPTNDAWEDGRG